MVKDYGYVVQKSYMFFFFFLFFVIILSLSYNYYYDQKTGVALFDGFKTELRLTLDPPQIDMFKIGILILKTTYIGFWWFRVTGFTYSWKLVISLN